MPQLRLYPFDSGRQAHRQRLAALRKLEAMGLLDFVRTTMGSTDLKTESVYTMRLNGRDPGNQVELSLGAREVLAWCQGMMAALAAGYTADDNRLIPVVDDGWEHGIAWYLDKLPATDERFARERTCTAADDTERTQACTACSAAKRTPQQALELCLAPFTSKQLAAPGPDFHGCAHCWHQTLVWKAERAEAVLHIGELHALLTDAQRANLPRQIAEDSGLDPVARSKAETRIRLVLQQALIEYKPAPTY